MCIFFRWIGSKFSITRSKQKGHLKARQKTIQREENKIKYFTRPLAISKKDQDTECVLEFVVQTQGVISAKQPKLSVSTYQTQLRWASKYSTYKFKESPLSWSRFHCSSSGCAYPTASTKASHPQTYHYNVTVLFEG